MSTDVTGVRDLDGKFASMMAVKRACEVGGVGYPPELHQYFGDAIEEPEGCHRREMEVVDISDAVHKCECSEGTDGWEVDLSKLPEGVKAIRFENCY